MTMPIFDSFGTRPVTKILSKEELRGFFKQHDKNGDGRLERNELKQAFRDLGAILPSWRASRGLGRADANGDGYISEKELDELVEYAFKLGYTVN